MTSNTPIIHASSPSLAASGRPEHAASAGFTLIEIIMCLVLLAILASAAFSSLSMPDGAKAEAEATLRSMLARIAHARSLSIMQPGEKIDIDLTEFKKENSPGFTISGEPTTITFLNGKLDSSNTATITVNGTNREITIDTSGYAKITE